MKWGAIAAGVAALVLAAGAFGLAWATRADGPGMPAINKTIAPAAVVPSAPPVVTTVVAQTVTAPAPAPAQPVAPAPKQAKPAKRPSCQSNGDPTGSDTPSCGSGDGGGDNQAGDGKSGGA